MKQPQDQEIATCLSGLPQIPTRSRRVRPLILKMRVEHNQPTLF